MEINNNITRQSRFHIGDLVDASRGIVVKVHDKADNKKSYYLVHYLESGEQHWVSENQLDEFFNSEVCE